MCNFVKIRELRKIVNVFVILVAIFSCDSSGNKVSSIEEIKQENSHKLISLNEKISNADPKFPLAESIVFKALDSLGRPIAGVEIDFFLANATGLQDSEITLELIEEAWMQNISALKGGSLYNSDSFAWSDPESVNNTNLVYLENVRGRIASSATNTNLEGFASVNLVAPKNNIEKVVLAARIPDQDTTGSVIGFYIYETANIGETENSKYTLTLSSDNLNVEKSGEAFGLRLRLLKNGDFVPLNAELELSFASTVVNAS